MVQNGADARTERQFEDGMLILHHRPLLAQRPSFAAAQEMAQGQALHRPGPRGQFRENPDLGCVADLQLPT